LSAQPITFAPPALPSLAPAARGFAALDERVRCGQGGLIVVQLVESATADAVLAHVARRALHAHPMVLRARARRGAPLWREVAARLSLLRLDCSPVACATQIASAALARRTAIVATLPAEGTWDRAVANELAQLESAPLVVFVSARANEEARDLRAETYELAPTLSAEERDRWLEGVALEARTSLPFEDLVSLEAWWAAARSARAEAPSAKVVPESGARLFQALALAGRAMSESDLHLLGATSEELSTLLACGAFVADRGWISTHAAWADVETDAVSSGGTATNELAARVAMILERRFPDDPWAQARVAELYVRTGSVEAADRAYGRALDHADESLARREIAASWMRAVESLSLETQLPLRQRAAERALASGEADEAYRWAKSAAATAPLDAAITLLLGRAAVAMGDLVTAKVALERGRSSTTEPEHRAQLAAELAEVAYLTGDHATAAKEATAALEATLPATRLRARNTLGKLLLAASLWEQAEQHFTEDVHAASAASARTEELRAHVNRGIAVLSRGHVEEAQGVFETVLEEGERLNDTRASAFALDNLAVAAMWRHDYGAALELSERTLKLRLRLGDRLSTARILANLAELRAKLGLVAHAEHAVAFGRRLVGPGMPTNLTTHFCVVAARIGYARGRLSEAQREVGKAIAEQGAADNGELVGEAYRVAARIALEDGDHARARASVAAARELATKDYAHGEVALLEAMVARAEGTLDDALLSRALLLARAAGEEELLREAHVLAYEVHRSAGNVERARAHAEQAIVLRDVVAATLEGEVKSSFLARADVVKLETLTAALKAEELPDSDGPTPRTQRSARAITYAREIIGDDPTIRALLSAIRKVGKSDSTVLVRGESGTGKELVAEALHRASDRANGPFVAVNCAALVETLLLSELFGHEKGSFTGAAARRRGRFEMADGGTLFLDEIGDISPRTQVALLRVLQERTFERVGGTTPIRSNCRIVCATHRDLKAMVERGEFREDLYYRLRGITLEVPALRNRMGDLPRIADNLLGRIAAERGESTKSLAPDAVELLGRHRWAGNIRELENALRAASLFAEGSVITAADLTDNVEDMKALAGPRAPVASIALASVHADDDETVELTDFSVEDGPLPAGEAGPTAVAYACVRQGSVSLADLKRQIERDCIARALAETRGNITKAAALLGMKRPRLSQLVKQYGLAATSTEA
jgi:transcriptional regulator with GAF, ATPase, and Fis domain